MKKEIDTTIWRTNILSQLQELNMPISKLAEKTGYVKGSMYNVFRGDAEPSIQMIMLVEAAIDQAKKEKEEIAKIAIESEVK